MQAIKGWKTIGFGLILVIVPPALTYLAGVDWTHLIGANAALIISGVITIALRAVTDTPLGKSS